MKQISVIVGVISGVSLMNHTWAITRSEFENACIKNGGTPLTENGTEPCTPITKDFFDYCRQYEGNVTRTVGTNSCFGVKVTDS